jgi:fimbrial chaperone protein
MAESGQAEARLRFTIPVFFDRDKAVPAKLQWRLGADRLEVVNAGGATSRIISVELRAADGRVVPLERNALRYVQGNSSIAWGLDNGCALGPVTITAQIDGQTAHAQASPTCG